MNYVIDLIRTEPARALAIVQTALAAGVVLGWVSLTEVQMAAVLGFASALLGIGIRQAVTSNANLARPQIPPSFDH
jgi:hypothetical protein